MRFSVIFSVWGLIGVFIVLLFPSVSNAIPAFARKYDISCTSCHTKPPRLNAFGEAFHMAGFQIPMIRDEEIKKKKRIGRIFSEIDFLNIFSIRVTGNFIEAPIDGEPTEANLTLPQSMEIYFAGTLAPNTSYFFEIENEAKEIEGNGNDGFEEVSRFGIGKEFFLMFDLGPFWKGLSGKGEKDAPAMVMDEQDGPLFMGPMVMVGKVDPSTNFSYSTNRQIILNIPGRADGGKALRFSLTPYAFASKFYGIRNGAGELVEPTRSVLYNTTGEFAVDFHAMRGPFMLQAGVMQGLMAGTTDMNAKKDPYLMARVNFNGRNYTSGSFSGLAYWGNDTARVNDEPVDWFRYGFSGNIKYRVFDLYGAVIWDQIRDLSAGAGAVFDDSAFGVTVEADYLASSHVLLSVRYDHLSAGGFLKEKADGKVLTAQVRYYVRDNFALYLRDSHNIEKVSLNPIQNFRNFITLGVDLDF